ncbi:hypothetical protein SK128_017981 [Halocaridina rubra]|uniref:Uncharacterized protein n=1 Tax=Halocaridina rubra TaxID=373956 RepID=A0AAN8XGL0_HALRR
MLEEIPHYYFLGDLVIIWYITIPVDVPRILSACHRKIFVLTFLLPFKGKSSLYNGSREDPLASHAVGAWLHLVNNSWEKRICHKPEVKERDISKIVDSYVKFVRSADVLEKIPGRKAYKDVEFAHNIFIKKPNEMVDMLKDLSEKDESRQMNEQESDMVE